MAKFNIDQIIAELKRSGKQAGQITDEDIDKAAAIVKSAPMPASTKITKMKDVKSYGNTQNQSSSGSISNSNKGYIEQGVEYAVDIEGNTVETEKYNQSRGSKTGSIETTESEPNISVDINKDDIDRALQRKYHAASDPMWFNPKEVGNGQSISAMDRAKKYLELHEADLQKAYAQLDQNAKKAQAEGKPDTIYNAETIKWIERLKAGKLQLQQDIDKWTQPQQSKPKSKIKKKK